LKSLRKGIEQEKAVLGSLIVDSSILPGVHEKLTSDSFVLPQHRDIYAAIMDLYSHDKSVAAAELAAKLRGKGVTVGGCGDIAEYLSGLMELSAHAGSALRMAGELHNLELNRRVTDILDRANKQASDGSLSSSDLAELIGQLSDAGANRKLSECATIGDIAKTLSFDADPDSRGIPTGIADLDSKSNILNKGYLTVLAGRPSMGKSSLMREMILAASRDNPVLVCSLEEPRDVFVKKIIYGQAQVNTKYIEQPWLEPSEGDIKALVSAANHLASRPIYFYSNYGLSANDLSVFTRQLELIGKKPKVVFIDYLQLMTHPSADSTNDAVGKTTRRLKLWAVAEEICVVLLSQLNREVERRSLPKPKLSDLRDSGSIEQDADNILFISAEDIADMSRVLSLAKHRGGRTGDMEVVFAKECGRIKSMASSVEEYEYAG